MENYNYQKDLKLLWENAVTSYSEGKRGSESFFTDQENEFIASIGATPQEIYDFAEDFYSEKTPDFTTFAMLQDIRRSYFLEVQRGKATGKAIDKETLPGVMEEAGGIRWLPRILAKAKAKLHGELHPDIMYGCGGDRNFLQMHDIHAAEFLRIVWMNEGNDKAIIDWVVERSAS